MDGAFARTELLLGAEAMRRLARARVAVFGVGGVGGYVCEALARSGVGRFELVDSDTVSLTNLNRQIIATRETVGCLKVDVMRERILSINPEAEVTVRAAFVLPETVGDYPFGTYDYAVDAVDTVAAKLALIVRARETGTPVISSMGAGNKLDGSRFRVTDIAKTSADPLARVMRRELRRRGIDHVKVVWSDEPPRTPLAQDGGETPPPGRRSVPGSTAFVPSVAGLMIAGEVVRDLIRVPGGTPGEEDAGWL